MAAWVRGTAVEVETAVAAAAALLAPARAPVIAGLAADVDAIRAAYRLAARLGASLDPIAAPALYADLAAFAGAGAVTTTPSETLARADLVLCLGAAARSPLAAELARSHPTVGRTAGADRSVLVLGDIGDSPAYPAEPGGLAPSLGLLRGLATGRLAGDSALADLARRLRAARFGVALYEPAELGELGVEMLHGLAAELNETTRFFTLALADAWQGRAVLQVGAWMTSQGPRVGFGRGVPEHDPWRFDGARQAAAGEVDAALWLASLPAPRPAWTRAVPCVALTGAEGASGSDGEVVIRVGVPGEEAPGALWDARRGALAFRPAERPGPRPTAAAVLDGIAAGTPDYAARC